MTIWQHVPFENEAAIGEWARMRGISYRIIRCWENAPLEADDLLVVLGGSMSAYDDIGFIKNEIEFLRKRIDHDDKRFKYPLVRNSHLFGGFQSIRMDVKSDFSFFGDIDGGGSYNLF